MKAPCPQLEGTISVEKLPDQPFTYVRTNKIPKPMVIRVGVGYVIGIM